MIWSWLLRNPLQSILGGLALAFFAAAGVQSWRLGAEQDRHARTVAQYQVELIDRQRAAIEATEAFRRQEQDWQRQTAAAEAEYAKALAARDRVIADLRRTADELRSAAARYAVGRPAADDSLDSCRARAATLAELFSEADAEAGRMAEAADRHAEQVGLCVAAWPTPLKVPN